MTISHRQTRSRTSSASTARQNNASSSNGTAEGDRPLQTLPPNDEQTHEPYLRGSASLPPVIPNERDRPLLTPEGKTQWVQVPTLGDGRTPASALTCLLKKHYPGLVEYRGKTVPATTWKHFEASRDSAGVSKADIVEQEFWLRFRYDPENEDAARQQVARCCKQLLASIIYYARIYATIDHFRKVENRVICDKIAGKFYLSLQEYVAQRPVWCQEDCWHALAAEWSHPDFKKKSETNRANRYSDKFKPHKGGSNSIAAIRQKLSIKKGREVSQVEAWVYTHRGPNPENPSVLNTEEATACLERYKSKAMELNGPDFDWLNSPVDVRALYECSCGRPHGKWAIFNGIVDDSEALAELKNSRTASSNAAKRKRQEQAERAQMEARECRAAKEYTQVMYNWGRAMQGHNETMQKFLENMAAHVGMPSTAIPTPPPPPPPPPTYGVSASPNPSPNNVDTFGSTVGGESPEETLQRIAQGNFGGRANGTGSAGQANGTGSGGGTYSPPLEDDFNPFDL